METDLVEVPRKLGNIQILRGFAALAVIMYHIVNDASISQGININLFDSLGHWGFCGVDVFFVISGFVMVESQRNRPTNSFEFLKARMIRIIPLYWLLTLCYWIFALIAPRYFPHIVATPSWLFSSLFFSSSALGFGKPIIGQGWTLEFEMLFYLIFAASLWLRNSSRSGVVTIVIITLAIFSLKLDHIMFEFCFGLLAGLIHQKTRPSQQFGFLLIFFGAGILLLELFTGDGTGNRILHFGLPSLVLILGIASINQSKNRFLLALGEASYSSYLFQFFAIPILFKMAEHFPIIRAHGDILVILFTLISVTAGQVLYLIVERKLAAGLKKYRRT
jgi:hypothetical protein